MCNKNPLKQQWVPFGPWVPLGKVREDRAVNNIFVHHIFVHICRAPIIGATYQPTTLVVNMMQSEIYDMMVLLTTGEMHLGNLSKRTSQPSAASQPTSQQPAIQLATSQRSSQQPWPCQPGSSQQPAASQAPSNQRAASSQPASSLPACQQPANQLPSGAYTAHWNFFCRFYVKSVRPICESGAIRLQNRNI